MKIVFDADILSCIAKIEDFDFIKEIFPESEYLVPRRVYEEITKAKKSGYDFSDYIINLIDKSILVIPTLPPKRAKKSGSLNSLTFILERLKPLFYP